MLERLRRWWVTGLKWPFQGERFRRYAPRNPAPEPGSKLRIAICFLIPYLGDSVLVFPLLDAIAREHPKAEISVFVSGIGKVLGSHPAVTRVYEQPHVPRIRRRWPIDLIFHLWMWWRSELRGLRFDFCLLPRCGSDPFCSAHLAWMLGARERVGYSESVEPERSAIDLNIPPLLTKAIVRLELIREVDRESELLAVAGLVSTPIDSSSTSEGLLSIARSEEGMRFVSSSTALRAKYFVLSPAASIPRKRWPTERFAEVAKGLVAAGWFAVLVGGNDAVDACAAIASELQGHVLNLAGGTTFVELTAVCAGAALFIGNDSGTGHVAGACGVPSLIVSSYSRSSRVMHQTSPERTRLAGPSFIAVQPDRQMPPCTEECMSDDVHCIAEVSVQQVREGLRALINGEILNDPSSASALQQKLRGRASW